MASYVVSVKAETSSEFYVDAEDEDAARDEAESRFSEMLDSSKLPKDMYWESVEAYDCQIV